MFQSDQTKNHFYHCMKDLFRYPFIHLFFFLSFFLILHFSWFLFQQFCFVLAHFYVFSGVSSTSLELHFLHLPSSIRHLIVLSSREDFSLPLPPSVEGDPWLGYRRKHIKLKRGDYGHFFSISLRG